MNETTRSIQLGSMCTTLTGMGVLLSWLEVDKLSTIIILGKLSPMEVCRVASELAWVFLLLDTWFMVKVPKLACNCFTWPKYHHILWSLASNSPWTCPTTSLESQKTLMDSPSSFLIESKTVMRASYYTSLFVAKKSNLKDFSMVMCSREIMTVSILEPLILVVPSTYNVYCGRRDAIIAITPLISIPCSSMSSFSASLVNSATKLTRTCSFMAIRRRNLMSKALNMVPHFATLLMKSNF